MKHLIKTTALATLLAAPAVAGTTLTYGSWSPASDPNSIAMDAYSAEVTEATGGELQFDNLYDGTVVKIRTVLSGIQEGLVDAGYVAGTLFAQEMPIEKMLTNYASIQSSPYAITAAINEVALTDCETCDAEKAANDVRVLAYAGSPHFYLMCANPISSFSDLEGKSVRAASANLRLANRMGATPVNTPTTEVLEALQRGQVECAIGSMFWLQAYSLWDAVSYVVDFPVGQFNNGMVMTVSNDVWEDLDQSERDAMTASLPTLASEAARAGTLKATEVREESIKRGVVWGEPTEEMVAFMNEWFLEERALVENLAVEEGVPNAAEILDKLEASVARWNAAVDETGGDHDALKAMMAEQIFDKL